MKDFNNLTKEERKQLKSQQRSETAVWLKEVGKRLRNARNASGMLQSDVSDLLMCSDNHSSDIETGLSDFAISELKALCERYNVSADIILNTSVSSNDEFKDIIVRMTNNQLAQLRSYAKFLVSEKN